MSHLRIQFMTGEGMQDMPPEAFAQAFEDFMLARYFQDPDSLDSRAKARNLRNHMYRFITEPIRVRTELDAPQEFVYMGKDDLIQLHQDLTMFETYIVKRCSIKRQKNTDTLEAISRTQEEIETVVRELS